MTQIIQWTDTSKYRWLSATGVYTREIKNKNLHNQEVIEHRAYTFNLEEINKFWDRPYNWQVSISVGDKLLGIEKFYLNKEQSSLQAAQQRVNDIINEIVK